MNLAKRVVGIALMLAMCVSVVNIPVAADSAGNLALGGSAHVQDIGDQNGTYADGVLTLGTTGQSKRLESITVNFTNNTAYAGTLEYKVHVQNIGWSADWVDAGQSAGTHGQSLRLEAIEMQLTGDLANHYVVMYRVHIQDYGDAQGWKTGGLLAGTTGESKRLEQLQVMIVPKDQASITPSVLYRVHRQDYGWETEYKSDGLKSGTTGEGKRLEAIYMDVFSPNIAGGITYRTHIQDIGWQDWVTGGNMSGTEGQSKRLEGIEIKLTGDLADKYDVYYRVHAQDFGWLDWAKNGETSGTVGRSKRLEAIQVVLVAKGGAAPGAVYGVNTDMPGHVSLTGSDRIICLDAGHIGVYNQSPVVKSYYESNFTWKLHNYLAQDLQAYGFIVVKTRATQDTPLGVYERGLCANGCDLFISIHSDASSNHSINNPSAYCSINGQADVIGDRLASTIQNVMGVQQYARYNRHGSGSVAYDRDYYGVLRGCTDVGCPGILLEHSFHTNAYAANWLLSDENLQKLAAAEALVIAQYYGKA